MIYFIENAQNAIKIGVTKDLKSRLSALSTSLIDKLTVKYILNLDGKVDDFSFESHIHQICERYHIRGEWFEGSVLDHLQSIPWFKKNMVKYRDRKN